LHILKYTLFFTIITLFTTGHLYAKAHKDFLIIENAAPLKVYDHYQQELTQSQKANLLSGIPLQIINDKELLGDQITTAFHVSLGKNRNYFIINDENHKIINRKDAGEISILKSCTVINDSIYIKRDNLVKIKDQSTSIDLQTGSKLIRFLKYKNRYYVKQISPQIRFGWIRLIAKNSWGKIKAESVTISTNNFKENELHDKILAIFNKGNRLYRQFFDFFSEKTLESAQAPYWQIESGGNNIRANFVPDSLLPNFRSSFEYTQRQVENILIGTPYTITTRQNRIFISRGDK
jgi:hypothetical protein